MARKRKCKYLPFGEYEGSAIWRCGRGIEERLRYADGVGIKVTEVWVYLYLGDGEEVVRLNRKANGSAQIYLNTSLRDALKERIVNSVENSSVCCWGKFGLERERRGEDCLFEERRPCNLHTPEWLEAQVDSEIEAVVTDEEWPAVLAQRKIDAAAAQEKLEQQARDREAAKAAGYGEWYKSDRVWCISIAGRNEGDVVPVRRRDGTVSYYQLGNKVSDKLYIPGGEVQDSEASAQLVSQSEAARLREMFLQ